jgi:hypothetical protein
MKNSKFDFSKNFTARVEIEDLEKRSWDFNFLYKEVATGQKISIEAAEAFEKENYCVSIEVNEDGATTYVMCQKAHYGNECFGREGTGDDNATIADLEELYKDGLLWDCEQTD